MEYNKYLILSCLQKAIRRGMTDNALHYVNLLWRKDRSHLMYRLSIIAVEDIGAANIDLIYDFLTSEIKTKEIDRRGGINYVQEIVKKFCESPKDRTSSDISYYCLDKKFNDYLFASEVYLDPEEPIANRVNAIWAILGTKKIKHRINDFNGMGLEKFIDINRTFGADEKVLKICEICYKFQAEPHLIALPLCSMLYNNEKNKRIIEKILIPAIEIKDSLITAGIDGHTMEGKISLDKLMEQNLDIKNYFNDKGVYDKKSMMYQLKNTLFRIEGHEVNKRIYYVAAKTVSDLIMDKTDDKILKNIIYKNIEQLNKIRADIIYKMSNNSSHKI